MRTRELPDTLSYDCPDCDEETEHQILRGKMGKSTIEGTFRCNSCGKITSETIRIPELIEVPVIYSDGDVSESTRTTIESNDVIEIDDEFELDDGRLVCVTHIDVIEGPQKKKVIATNVKKLWVKQFDVLSVKVSVNDGQRTYPLRVQAEPDDEFVVGTQLSFDDFDCLIHAIKTKHSLVRRGAAEARDITRIYGKIRKKQYEVLDFDDDFDESDYIIDDDDRSDRSASDRICSRTSARLSERTICVAASSVYGSVALNAIDMAEFSNILMSVKEFPIDTVRSLEVPYLAIISRTLIPLSLRSTMSLPSPVSVPSS